MICSESCNSSQGGPMMSAPGPKNEALTLCVGMEINRIPIPNVLEGSL